jgi:hypothetical protein
MWPDYKGIIHIPVPAGWFLGGNSKFYDQKCGKAMGSILALIVASYFMEGFEHQALNMAPKYFLLVTN